MDSIVICASSLPSLNILTKLLTFPFNALGTLAWAGEFDFRLDDVELPRSKGVAQAREAVDRALLSRSAEETALTLVDGGL